MGSLFRWFRRWLCQRYELRADGPRIVRGRLGERLAGALRVRVTTEDGAPAVGVPIRFWVVKGSASWGDSKQELRAKTDAEGLAVCDATLTEVGYALFGAEMVGRPHLNAFFDARTEGVTDRIEVFAEPCVPAERGLIEVEVSAVDMDLKPVSGADLSLEGHRGFGPTLRGPMTEVAPGRYRGSLETNQAWCYQVVVQDLETLVKGSAVVHMTPAAARKFDILSDLDPRAGRPFDTLDLRVKLVDRFGNALRPDRIRATVGVAALEHPTVLSRETAQFTIKAAGYTAVSVRLQDTDSGIEELHEINFGACWLEDPGLVLVGDTYKTPLHAVPPPDRPADHATITIDFDPELVAFEGHEPPTDQHGLSSVARVEGQSLIIDFESETPFSALDHPAGIYLGDLSWTCLGEGETCFGLIGRMSPSTPKWELCVSQKKELNTCICINIVYPEGDTDARAKGDQAIDELVSLLNDHQSNQANCCPYVRVRRRYCDMPQARINAHIGANGKVETELEWENLGTNSYCMEVGCMNLYMVPTEMPGSTPTSTVKGRSALGPLGSGSDSYGFGVLDPSTVGDVTNVGAHELAHQLGPDHVDDPERLMHKRHTDTQGYGSKLSRGDCRKIFETLGSYPC